LFEKTDTKQKQQNYNRKNRQTVSRKKTTDLRMAKNNNKKSSKKNSNKSTVPSSAPQHPPEPATGEDKGFFYPEQGPVCLDDDNQSALDWPVDARQETEDPENDGQAGAEWPPNPESPSVDDSESEVFSRIEEDIEKVISDDDDVDDDAPPTCMGMIDKGIGHMSSQEWKRIQGKLVYMLSCSSLSKGGEGMCFYLNSPDELHEMVRLVSISGRRVRKMGPRLATRVVECYTT
jgi:hypothetical protein